MLRGLTVVAVAAWVALLGGCTTQPPSSELSNNVTGIFSARSSSGDRWQVKRLEVTISGSTGTLNLVPIDGSGSEIPFQLTRCAVLENGTVASLSWKSSFLDGQDADVVRCEAVGPRFGKHFAFASTRSGALAYHPPILARMIAGTREINSEQGRIIFLWDGSGTAAYAVSK